MGDARCHAIAARSAPRCNTPSGRAARLLSVIRIRLPQITRMRVLAECGQYPRFAETMLDSGSLQANALPNKKGGAGCSIRRIKQRGWIR